MVFCRPRSRALIRRMYFPLPVVQTEGREAINSWRDHARARVTIGQDALTLWAYRDRTQHSHPNHSPKPSRRVIRLHPVVVHEHPPITPVAEEGAAEGADVGWGVEPGGGLLVELAQGLQRAVLVFGQQFDTHFVGHADGAVLWFVFLSCFQGGVVVAEASAACRAFRGAIAEGESSGFRVVADHVRFAAGGFHGLERFQGAGIVFESGLDVGPGDAWVALHVLFEAGFQQGEQFVSFVGFHGVESVGGRECAPVAGHVLWIRRQRTC